MKSWVKEELQSLNLGDQRLNRRCVKIVESLSTQPNESIAQAMGNQAGIKATYRFWDSSKVKENKILEAHADSTLQRMTGLNRVLALLCPSRVSRYNIFKF